jgi:hypothetical protein
MANNIKFANLEDLFEIWADFDDSQSGKEVKRLIEEHGLGPIDAVSFSAFCFGFNKAVQKISGILIKKERSKFYATKTN